MDRYTHNAGLFVVYSLSEYAVTVEFGNRIDTDILGRIHSFNTLLQSQPFDGFRTAVPAYTTLSVYYDPSAVLQSDHLAGINCFERVSSFLQGLRAKWTGFVVPTPTPITIPLCYGGTFGPDLADMARQLAITPAETIQLHSSALYRVYFIGFTPGFAYLGGMPEQLAVPRKATPSRQVAAGSVGIAGKQTGIYPLETPGGWHIIGRTPLRIFDVNREEPALLKAGDTVIFQALEHELFERYNTYEDAHMYQ